MSAILYLSPAQQTTLNGLFDLEARISTTSPVTGLDFTILAQNATLLSRDVAGSSFPDLLSAGIDGDLGASVQDVAQALPAGDYLVAKLHFRVEGINATVLPKAFPGTVGYVMEAPGFVEKPFDGFGGASVLTPEPGVWLAFFWVWLTRRRG